MLRLDFLSREERKEREENAGARARKRGRVGRFAQVGRKTDARLRMRTDDGVKFMSRKAARPRRKCEEGMRFTDWRWHLSPERAAYDSEAR